MTQLYGKDEVAWLAGLFEGEGWLTREETYTKYGRRYTSWTPKLTAEICSTDFDVINHAQDVVNFGTVYGPYFNGRKKDGTKCKEIYRISWRGFEEVQAIFAMMYPWLGERRRKRFEEVLYAIPLRKTKEIPVQESS